MHARSWGLRATAAVLLALVAGSSQAIGVTDAVGDYVAGYTGSRAGDLDVIGSFVTYNPTTDAFVFSGTMAAAIGTSPSGFYVWGVNRGAGTAGFAANGLPGVLFDSVVIFNADGSGRVVRFAASGPPSTTTLAAGTAVALDSTIVGKVAGSLLPSNGFAKSDYTWNLWPRDGTLPAGFGQISDFAPDAINLPTTQISAVPEPGSTLMLLAGLVGIAALKRRT
jgi:hypothetical protein